MTRISPRILFAVIALNGLALLGCEEPATRIVHHVPDGVEALPPLALAEPRTVSVGGAKLVDDYSWFDQRPADASAWAAQQVAFSRAIIQALPDRAKFETRLRALGASPSRMTALYPTAAGIYYLLPNGVGGSTAPAHVMRTASLGVSEIGSVEQPAALRPAPSGKMVALGRTVAGVKRRIVVLDDLAKRIESIDNADAASVVWTQDSKSFYYVRTIEDVPSVHHHVIGEESSRDRTIFGGAAFGKNRMSSGDVITLAIGPKTITVEVRLRATKQESTAIFTAPIGFVETADPAWREVTPKGRFEAPTAHGDSLFLLARGDAKVPLFRLDLNQATGPQPFGSSSAPVTAAAEAEDALYVIRNGRVARIALPGGGDDEMLDMPGGLRAVGVEASPFVPGALVFFSSCTDGGWYAYPPGGRQFVALDVDPRVARGSAIATRTIAKDKAQVTVLTRKGLKAGAVPTVIFPHACNSFSPELLPWLESDNVAAFCDVHPIEATTAASVVEGRKRQSAELRACAHALFDEKVATPLTLGIRAGGEDGLVVLGALIDEPELARAVAIGQGVFDARRPPGPELLPEYRVADPGESAIGASVPYLHIAAKLPPFLLTLPPDARDPASLQSLKLAARLEAVRDQSIAALVVRATVADDGAQGPNGSAEVISYVDAFMTVALAPNGAGTVALAQRADAIYVNRHR